MVIIKVSHIADILKKSSTLLLKINIARRSFMCLCGLHLQGHAGVG